MIIFIIIILNKSKFHKYNKNLNLSSLKIIIKPKLSKNYNVLSILLPLNVLMFSHLNLILLIENVQ